MLKQLCFALLASALVVSNVQAEERAVPRSFSGGSAAADSISLQNKKAAKTDDLTARAMPRAEALSKAADKQTERSIPRSFSGGSASADSIQLKGK
jgi:hypothetical protein